MMTQKNNEQPHTMRIAGDLAQEFVLSMDERLSDGTKHYINSPFLDLDKMAPGWLHNGRLNVLAGRTSHGKSALAQQIGEFASNDKTVIFYTLEMSGFEIIERSICRRSGIPLPMLKDPASLDQAQWAAISNATTEIQNIHLLVDDASLDIQGLTNKTKAVAEGLEKRGMPTLGLVVVDYLQLISAGKRANKGNRALEVGEISGGLKRLAKELQVPVLALSQINRGVEGRVDKRPTMGDLRESGAIEQDADLILLVYRDEVYNADSPEKGVAEVIIAKNRHGATGTVKLKFQPERVSFANLAHNPFEDRLTNQPKIGGRESQILRGGNENF